MNVWNRSGERECWLLEELDEFLPVYLSLSFPFEELVEILFLHVEVMQVECGFNQPYLLEI